MKIKIERNKFLDALNIVKDVVSNSGIQIIQNIKLETEGSDTVRLTATDLDRTVSTMVKCEISEPGAMTVPAKMVVPMVGAMTSVMLELNHAEKSTDKAVLTGGDVTFKVATISPEEFPKSVKVEGNKVGFEQKELKDIIRKTVYAASLDTTRRALQSVCFQFANGELSAVATDGRRLACVKTQKETEGDFEVIIPTLGIKYIQKLLKTDGTVEMTVMQGKAVQFATEEWTVQTKIVDDAYPNWKQVIPKELASHIPIERSAFEDAVRQVSVSVDNNGSSCIKVMFKAGVMTFTATNADLSDAKTIIPVKYDGEEIAISLNPKYVQEALSAIDEDTVDFNVNSGSQPITFTSEGNDNVAVIMPLRLN